MSLFDRVTDFLNGPCEAGTTILYPRNPAVTRVLSIFHLVIPEEKAVRTKNDVRDLRFTGEPPILLNIIDIPYITSD